MLNTKLTMALTSSRPIDIDSGQMHEHFLMPVNSSVHVEKRSCVVKIGRTSKPK